ncbi:unnamed protein product [Ectocarpus fasciculatus]
MAKSAVGNVNAGESKHKELKESPASDSGRDNVGHVFRALNDNQGLKVLCNRVWWRARGRVRPSGLGTGGN